MFKLKSNKVMDETTLSSDEVIANHLDAIELNGKVIDFVLVYSSDKKKDDDEEADDQHHGESNRAGFAGPRVKKSEARVKSREIFLANLKSAGLMIQRVNQLSFFFSINLIYLFIYLFRLNINKIIMF